MLHIHYNRIVSNIVYSQSTYSNSILRALANSTGVADRNNVPTPTPSEKSPLTLAVILLDGIGGGEEGDGDRTADADEDAADKDDL